jgi:hypothetical protein
VPRKGPAFGITPDWQKWVRERINEMKKNGDCASDADFAERLAGIGKASLSEALKKGAVQTTVMREIHKALGWPPPAMALPVKVLEFVQLYMKLDEGTRGEMLGELREKVARARARLQN